MRNLSINPKKRDTYAWVQENLSRQNAYAMHIVQKKITEYLNSDEGHILNQLLNSSSRC